MNLIEKKLRQFVYNARFCSRRINSNDRVLPDALILGSQRAGSTSLYHYLNEHPRVTAPLTKEVLYFDNNYDKPVSWYQAHFPSKSNQLNKITLEASPCYLSHPSVPGRVKSVLPNSKFIVLMRNPKTRAYSHYQHNVRHGREPLGFFDALVKEQKRIAGEKERLMSSEHFYHSENYYRFSYVTRGLYFNHIKEWLKYFPSERFMFIQSEALFMEPQIVVNNVFHFLGLENYTLTNFKQFYRFDYDKGMTEEEIAFLDSSFYEANQELFGFLGKVYDWQ